MDFLSVSSWRFLDKRLRGAMKAAVTFPPVGRGRAPGGYKEELGVEDGPGNLEDAGAGPGTCRI